MSLLKYSYSYLLEGDAFSSQTVMILVFGKSYDFLFSLQQTLVIMP